MSLNESQISEFQKVVRTFYKEHGRHTLPWRKLSSPSVIDPYHVLVSEIMLQQTQVNRVIDKYHEFLLQYPTVQTLAEADLASVLKTWSGLGYNRRAKFLHQAAQKISEQYGGAVPSDIAELVTLPGVGQNTAAAICVYSFNKPAVFIETNIRTVFLHHFFNEVEGVADTDLMPLITATLPDNLYREWYWALMDYGSSLKKILPNPSRRSKHHVVQSKFEGSKRQLRGAVLKLLHNQDLARQELHEIIHDNRLEQVLKDLITEQLITEKSGVFSLG